MGIGFKFKKTEQEDRINNQLERGARASLGSENKDAFRSEQAARPSEHVTETGIQRERRLMSQVVQRVGGEKNWASLNNNPAEQWKIIKETLPKSDYKFLLAASKERQAAAKPDYHHAELYTTKQRGGPFRKNTAVLLGVAGDGHTETIASSSKRAIGRVELFQKTTGQDFDKTQVLGLTIHKRGLEDPLVKLVDQLADKGTAVVAKAEDKSGNRSSGVQRTPTNNQVAAPTAQQIINAAYDAAGVSRKDQTSKGFDAVAKHVAESKDVAFQKAFWNAVHHRN